MLNLLCPDHQLIIFRQFKERWQEFEQLSIRDKLKKKRKGISELEYAEAISRKSKEQIRAYHEQQKRINALNENRLKSDIQV